MIEQTVEELTPVVGTRPACRALGVSHATMFASPGTGASRTFPSHVEAAGRVEAIWFPFTANPWLKVWSIAPRKPLLSRAVTSPYNYPLLRQLPEEGGVAGGPDHHPAAAI